MKKITETIGKAAIFLFFAASIIAVISGGGILLSMLMDVMSGSDPLSGLIVFLILATLSLASLIYHLIFKKP